MSEAEAELTGRALSPEDWPTDGERRYAAAQAALAEYYDVGVESRVVQTDSAGRVHYLVAGPADGEPVCLLHGINVSGATWIPFLPSLTDEYRVYVPDRPGRGLSATHSYSAATLRSFMSGYVAEFMDAVGLDRPHVVGNSLGGLQAFLLAIDHDRVDRLCLVGAAGGLSDDFGLVFKLMTARGFNKLFYWLLMRGDPEESARDLMEEFNVTDTSAIPSEFFDVVATHQDLPGRHDAERSLALAESSWLQMHPVFDISEEVIDIERPTCFAWGSEDELFEPAVGREVAEQMPNAEFHELPEHGHTPWLEPEEGATEFVRSFLDG